MSLVSIFEFFGHMGTTLSQQTIVINSHQKYLDAVEIDRDSTIPAPRGDVPLTKIWSPLSRSGRKSTYNLDVLPKLERETGSNGPETLPIPESNCPATIRRR